MGRWMCKAGDHMNGWPAGRLMGQSGHQVDDWIGSMPCCEGAGAWPCRPPPPIELEQELSSIGGMASTVRGGARKSFFSLLRGLTIQI